MKVCNKVVPVALMILACISLSCLKPSVIIRHKLNSSFDFKENLKKKIMDIALPTLLLLTKTYLTASKNFLSNCLDIFCLAILNNTIPYVLQTCLVAFWNCTTTNMNTLQCSLCWKMAVVLLPPCRFFKPCLKMCITT